MEKKYTVEIELSEDVVANLEKNPSGLKIDDLMQIRIESALFPLCKGAILVYAEGENKKPINLFQKCPSCGHPWVKHFEQTKVERVAMSDGSIGTRGVLIDSVPTFCSECAEMVPKGSFSCREALKYIPKK